MRPLSTKKTSRTAIDRAVPPVPGRPARIVFPSFTVHRMRNGIPVYIVENHGQPHVSVKLVVRGGASVDGRLPGLANFVSTLLLSGAGSYSARELANEVDFLGATLDAGASKDEITVKLASLTRFLPEGLDLMRDVVLAPTFPDEEIDRERRHAIAALKQNQSDPAYLAAIQFRREIYGAMPYGSEVDGTAASLRRITRDDCVEFHRRYFTAGNSFFVAAGDVVPERLLVELESRFGVWPLGEPVTIDVPVPDAPISPRVVVVDRPGSVQSAVCVGGLCVARRDPDYLPMATISTLFGGYFNSRVNRNLRERHAYTYGAASTVDTLMKPGTFSVRTSVGAEVTGASIGEILSELHSISTEPVSEEELEMVKNYMLGAQALQTETPEQVAGFVRTIALYGLPVDYYERFPIIVRGLTREDLLAVTQRYLRPERMIIVAAGDAAEIVPQLEGFGPVTVVDAAGRRKGRKK